jgi:SAM-dependent methyltransferase
VDFLSGDAEEIPFPDESFDAVISVFGSMFAHDQRRVAAELVRVTRPGGTIALASWAPDGFVGEMFRTVAGHVPPPPGLASPLLWGTEDHVEELFGPEVTWAHARRTFTFRHASADAFVETFGRYYGPTVKALEAAGSERRALERDLRDLARSWNRLEEGSAVALPSAYLRSVGLRGPER